MEIYEAVTQIRKEKKLRIIDVHNKIKAIFGDKALSYRTLLRIENGDTKGWEASLYQICLALGITLQELKEKTTHHKKTSSNITYIKRNSPKEKYIYNGNTYAEIFTEKNNILSASELILESKGKTHSERMPLQGNEKYEKLVYVSSGKLICIINNEKFKLNNGDCIIFDSSLPHHFENNTSHKARCFIVQNKK